MRELLLTLGATAGVICLLASAAAVAFDIKPVVFQSGSMAPAIETGALAISRTVDAEDLAVGDVVTVPTATGQLVTHRIEDVSIVNGRANLVLRGDANDVADDQVYVVGSAPVVLFDVPKAGYALAYVNGPVGMFAGGLLVGLIAMIVLIDRRSGPGADGRRAAASARRRDAAEAARERVRNRPGRRRRAVMVSTASAVALTTAISTGPTNTLAYYSDSITATSGTFTAAAAPTAPCSFENGVLTVRLPLVAGATGYQLLLTAGTTITTIDVGPDGTAVIPASTLGVGVYVVTAVAVGVGGTIGAGVALGTFTVLDVLGTRIVTVLLCLNIDLQLPPILPIVPITPGGPPVTIGGSSQPGATGTSSAPPVDTPTAPEPTSETPAPEGDGTTPESPTPVQETPVP